MKKKHEEISGATCFENTDETTLIENLKLERF